MKVKLCINYSLENYMVHKDIYEDVYLVSFIKRMDKCVSE